MGIPDMIYALYLPKTRSWIRKKKKNDFKKHVENSHGASYELKDTDQLIF